MPSNRTVKWDDSQSRSASSRSSTVGGSSSASSYSGTHPDPTYADPRYEIGAQKETIQATVAQLDKALDQADYWKKQVDVKTQELHKYQEGTKAHIAGLAREISTLKDENEDLKKKVRSAQKKATCTEHNDYEALKEKKEKAEAKYAQLKKKFEKLDTKSDTPSSPEGERARRGSSKPVKETEAEKQKNRLSERFTRSNDGSAGSDLSSTKPPSSTRTTHGGSRARRSSTSSSRTERPYVEAYPGQERPARPTVDIPSPTSHRPVNYTTSAHGYAVAGVQEPVYSAAPRSAGMLSPAVGQVPGRYAEDGIYHAYPLHDPRMGGY